MFILLILAGFILAGASQVCNKYCDGKPAEDLSLVASFVSFEFLGRHISLNGQRRGDAGMVFGRIANGQPGDELWLDRSWDFGATWPEGSRLGLASVQDDSSEASTKAFNVDSENNIGVVRVCAKLQSDDKIKCSGWETLPICNDICDNADRLNVVNPVVVDRQIQHDREIELIASSQTRAMYGRIHNAVPGDELWLDRSWDAGVHWDGGSLLGKTVVAEGSTKTFTTAFNVDRTIDSTRLGFIRVCARVKDKEGVICSTWRRPPICNKICDNTQREAASDSKLVEKTEVFGRGIELFHSIPENVSFGRMVGGAGCEIWLDRSWDDGKTWEGHLGFGIVSEGKDFVDSTAFNHKALTSKNLQGRIRACGKTGDRHNVVCTHWHPRLPAIPIEDEDDGQEIVCNKVCDRDKKPLTDAEFVANTEIYFRKIEVIASYDKKVAYGKISRGFPKDEVWLERSWDYGKTSEGQIGYRTIPDAETSVNTPVYNYDSRSNHGKIRACGKAGDVATIVCTDWTEPKEPTKEKQIEMETFIAPRIVCNKVCDNTAAQQLASYRTVETTEVFNRKIELYESLKENATFGRINGEGGCEVWLDRTWDDGKTWETRRGFSKVIKGGEAVNTPVFNLFSGKGDEAQLGRIRVCGKTGNRDNVVCSHWYPRLSPQPELTSDQDVSLICGNVCDNGPPDSLLHPEKNGDVELFFRKIELFASSADLAAYGRISRGFPKDEVWIERTWDGGKTWDAQIGIRKIPDAETSISTNVYNYDDDGRQGKLRACGKAFDVDDVVCTEWTRPSPAQHSTVEPVRLVEFNACAASIIEYMRDSQDNLYHRFTHKSQEEALYEFKQLYCKNYGRVGNCNSCFKEVFQLIY